MITATTTAILLMIGCLTILPHCGSRKSHDVNTLIESSSDSISYDSSLVRMSLSQTNDGVLLVRDETIREVDK